ncbi:hypothetical protein HK103_002546 [Boothiomyces macroporosus]|uniref:HMG box domain-containing protein n=1 Tax=Boothiomyces macroporosus TaxID=261099 RepID=A0AAD5UA61_9FUNG|nr:hypothetical protein HK103_002546 [Boothiomyces macroporosus]
MKYNNELSKKLLNTAQSLNAKKPLNAFFLYRSEMKDTIMQEHHTHKANEIIRIAAEKWRTETKEVKEHYKLKSKQLYAEHAKKYPDFVWPSKTSRQQKLALRTTLLKVVNELGSPTLSESSNTTLSMELSPKASLPSPKELLTASPHSPKPVSPSLSNVTIEGIDQQFVQPFDVSSFFAPMDYQYTLPDPFPLYYNNLTTGPNPFDFLFD